MYACAALVKKADIVLENFRPGVIAKMGFGYERLRELNPGIILVSVSGFGQFGPYTERPAFDPLGQAMSGLMATSQLRPSAKRTFLRRWTNRSVTATFSMIFTDATASDALPNGTAIKAGHFTELLDAINAVQPGTNLSWPSPAPAVGGTVLAIHIQTLRQPLSLATVSPGAVIAAQHINEIRQKIRSLE